jgi:hypothetical protein
VSKTQHQEVPSSTSRLPDGRSSSNLKNEQLPTSCRFGFVQQPDPSRGPVVRGFEILPIFTFVDATAPRFQATGRADRTEGDLVLLGIAHQTVDRLADLRRQ